MTQSAIASPRQPAAADRLQPLWRQRYRNGQPPSETPYSETIDTILSHRTIRSYLPDPLPEGALEIAVAAAQSAPSSSNLQAWDVIAVEDPATKSRLNALAGNQRHIEEAPVLLVWLADLSRLRRIAGQQDIPSVGLDYLESFLLGVIDAALAAQNAVVALESLGLGTCYIGALRNHPEQVAAELDLPPEVVAVFGMTVGIPNPHEPADVKPRLPQRVVLHRERYRAADAEDLRGYDRALRSFQSEQSMPQIDWTRQAAQRISSVQALRNRDQLRQALDALGFRLR